MIKGYTDGSKGTPKANKWVECAICGFRYQRHEMAKVKKGGHSICKPCDDLNERVIGQ